MKKNKGAVYTAHCAVIAALYAVVSLLLAPVGFGPVQFRASEALTILPVFTPMAIVGLTLGCAITNAVGAATGMSILGVWDILFGTLASLIAAYLSYKLRNKTMKGLSVWATIPPVLVNAVILGMEFSFAYTGTFNWGVFGFNALTTALSQLVPCVVLGLLLQRVIQKTKLKKIFE